MLHHLLNRRILLPLYDRYIIAQILRSTSQFIITLTAVLVIGTFAQKSQAILVDEQASLKVLLFFILSKIPYFLSYSLPCAFLVATLSTTFRLSQDNELNNLRMAGLSYPRIALPTIIIAILLTAFCWYINHQLSPFASYQSKQILYNSIQTNPEYLIKNQAIKSQSNAQFFVTDSYQDQLQGWHILLPSTEKTDQAKQKQYLYSETATVDYRSEDEKVYLSLNQAYLEKIELNSQTELIQIDSAQPVLFDLKKERSKVKPIKETGSAELITKQRQLDKPQQSLLKRNITIEWHQRSSLSLACLILGIIGFNLGLTKPREEKQSRFIIGLSMAGGYLLLFTFAKELDPSSLNLKLILLWLPNILGLSLVSYQFYRQIRHCQ